MRSHQHPFLRVKKRANEGKPTNQRGGGGKYLFIAYNNVTPKYTNIFPRYKYCSFSRSNVNCYIIMFECGKCINIIIYHIIVL